MDIVTDERIELMTGSVWNIQKTTGRLSCTGLGKHPRTDDWIRNVAIRYRDDIVDPDVLGRRRSWRDAWRVTELLTRHAVRWTGVAMTTEVTVMASSAVMLTRPELNVCKRRNSAFRPTRWRWRPRVVRRMARHCSWTHPRRPATGLIDMHVGWLDTAWDLHIYALRWTGVTMTTM